MSLRFEKWLEERLGVLEDEIKFSPDARERMYSRSQGHVAVPSGDIHLLSRLNRLGEPETIYYATGVPRYAHMTENEILEIGQVVDRRILGPENNKFDAVFSELRSPEAQTRFERVRVIAKQFKGLDLISEEALLATENEAERPAAL